MTDLKVVSISKEVPTGDNVLEYMEECYNIVKQGGVDNIIIVMGYANGDLMDCRANNNKPFLMIGALEVAKQQILATLEDDEL